MKVNADLGPSVEPVADIDCRKCGVKVDVSDRELFSTLACTNCGATMRVPGLFKNFVLLKPLGQGALGTVFRAFDQKLQRKVAITVMHGSFGKDPRFVKSFLREAQSLAALSHPNIVQVYSCGKVKGRPYIEMELVDGGGLEAWIESGQPAEEARALQAALEVAEGLEAANQIGLIHGDIKPHNILFDTRNEARVVDFGLARQAGRGDLTVIGSAPEYVAPEKTRREKEDHRADIYSLGATLYHLLAGGRPVYENVGERLRELRPDLDPVTVKAIERMMQPEPFRR
ncbi:MAG: serine/threonine-protein kinase, partial [Verrucomicrobiota bacterium]